MLRIARGTIGWALSFAAVIAGVGWLYLLRDVGALNVGPKLGGALPLEELAGHGAQPLLRVALAWLPAGFAMGAALVLCTRLRTVWVGFWAGVLAFLILGATTAESEAVSHNEHFMSHLKTSLMRPGLWAAVGFVVIGSLLAAAALKRARGDREAASSAGRWSGSSGA